MIWFDKRGTGLSDREVGMPTLEERMDDVRAVMDTVGVGRATLFGVSEGGSMCALWNRELRMSRTLAASGDYLRTDKGPMRRD